MTDLAWIDAALTSARPQALGALLRYFRNLDTAEEAFQNACLRALKAWPQNGPPRDAAAWLIMVGRNVAIDELRRGKRQQPLPADDRAISDLEDAESEIAERLDGSHYRDDILRLLFICCHPQLPATQQIALALRIVSGLTVKQIARAFLVTEAAMEQRITRAKAAIARAEVPFEAPDALERTERLAAVAAMLYLIFNEGYSASGDEIGRAPLCGEAIRLSRLLLKLFPAEPEIMGLAALMLLQHARAAARFDAGGALVLLDDQDRSLWNDTMIAEGLALIDKAMRHHRSGPYQIQAAIAALHARAARPDDTDWAQIDLLYGALEILQPSPVVTLNRSVAVAKVRGPEAALAMIAPLGAKLSNYFHFFGVQGAYLMQLGRSDAARESFNRAIALANTTAEADHIRMHLDRLLRDSQAS
jgi:RNA polymerase sigma-70 factor (ECF subfamily)